MSEIELQYEVIRRLRICRAKSGWVGTCKPFVLVQDKRHYFYSFCLYNNFNPQNAKSEATLDGILSIAHVTVPGWDTQTLHVKLLAKAPSVDNVKAGDAATAGPSTSSSRLDAGNNGLEERVLRWFSLEELKELKGEDGLLGAEPIELMQHIQKGNKMLLWFLHIFYGLYPLF